jgi:1,4-dihydroxy-2-naphthoate octaprenyltransferase
MTAISVSLAAAASAGVRAFPWLSYFLVLAGKILVHAATNLLNDYFDVRHGVDRPDSPTARYRAHPLIDGSFTPRQVLSAALACYGVALILAGYLAALRGPVVLVFAAVGGLASVFNTAGPVRYKHLALGEASVFLAWGPLMMLATSTIVTGGWERALRVGFLSIVQGLWVALVIFANNLKDISFDETTRVRTVANLMGKSTALRAFIGSLAAIYLLAGVLIALGVIPVWGIAVLLSLPSALLLVQNLLRSAEVPVDADPRTAQTGMIFGLLLLAAFLVGLAA